LRELMALVEPGARGDPMSPLRWTCKSLRQLAAELVARGHRVSRSVVGELLKAQKFSLQANSKTNEGGDHPDRDAQFSHINQSVTTALAAQQPVISGHHDQDGPEGDRRTRRQSVSQRHRRLGRGTGRYKHCPGRFSRRMELHYQAVQSLRPSG
jgi:hypothetical protein